MQLISKKALDFKSQAKRFKSIESLTFTGFFVALYIVLYLNNIIISNVIQFRLTFLVIAVSAMYGGPIMGLTVGIIGDLLSFFLSGGQGATYFPGFTISYALMGILFGLIFFGNKINITRAGLGAFAEFLISIFLNTYWLSILYGSPYLPLFITRAPKSLIMIIVSWVLLFIILKTLGALFRQMSLIKD